MPDQKDNKDDLIISRPENLSQGRKGVEAWITAAGWVLWAFLCRPVFLGILWFLGFEVFYEHMIRLKGIQGLADYTVIYAVVIFVLYILIRGWNAYNSRKFRGKNRRIRSALVTAKEMGRFFDLPIGTVEAVQAAGNVAVDIEDGKIRLRTAASLSIFFLFLFTTSVHAGHLNETDIARLKAAKQLTRDVDQKPLQQSIKELERTPHPLLNLHMKEAMARTYADIVRDQNIDGQKRKDWLYSMVTLNMAYLQFGGSSNTDPLNKMICRKLKEYLPKDILKDPDFLQSVD